MLLTFQLQLNNYKCVLILGHILSDTLENLT